MALRDLIVRNAKPREKAYKLSDGGGLYLYVSPVGGKLWRWDYRYDGKGKTMAFGKYPDVPLVFARERHAEARALLATGVDPMIRRKQSKTEEKMSEESAFSKIAAKWLEHWKHGKSARYVDSTSRRLETNILPFLGEKLVSDITAPHLVGMVKVIQERGARDIAKRALETTAKSSASPSPMATQNEILPQMSGPPMCYRKPSKQTMRVSMQRNCPTCCVKSRSIPAGT